MMVGSTWRERARELALLVLVSAVGFFLGLEIYIAFRNPLASLVVMFGLLFGYIGWRYYRMVRLGRTRINMDTEGKADAE